MTTFRRPRGRFQPTPARGRHHLYRRTQSSAPTTLPMPPLRPLLILLVASLIFWLLFASGLFRVNTIIIDGLRTIPATQIRQESDHIVSGSHLLWLPRDSEWLYPTGAVRSGLQRAFPALSSVRISHTFFHTITITVTERAPALIWQTSGRRYLVDADGIVAGNVPSGYRSSLTVIDSTNLPTAPGKQVLPPDFISFMQTVVKQLPGTVDTSVTQVSVGQSTLEATVSTARGYQIFFDTTRSPDVQLGYLKEIVDQIAAKHEALSYVDLRVDNRIFYKLK